MRYGSGNNERGRGAIITMARLYTIIRLAWQDYTRDWLLSLCAVCALAAAITPLLAVWGVRNGIITTLTERLLENPRNLEVTSVGTGRYQQNFFDDLRNRATIGADVAFVTPETRSIAAKMLLEGPRGSVQADLAPTGDGDPLLLKWGAIPANATDIILSASAAERIGIATGGTLTGRLTRIAGVEERVTLPLTVIAILPEFAYSRAAAFVRLELLDAVEDFRNGFAVDQFNWPGWQKADAISGYAGFRIVAKTPAGVARIQTYLRDKGIEVYTRAEEIEMVTNLDRAFTLVFGVLFAVVGAGAFASAVSSSLGQIARKRRSLAVLRLLGFSSRHLVFFGLAQSAITGFFAAIGACGLYLIVQIAINRFFSGSLGAYEAICRLDAAHYLVTLLLSTVLMTVAAAFSGRTLLGIEPSEALRDV